MATSADLCSPGCCDEPPLDPVDLQLGTAEGVPIGNTVPPYSPPPCQPALPGDCCPMPGGSFHGGGGGGAPPPASGGGFWKGALGLIWAGGGANQGGLFPGHGGDAACDCPAPAPGGGSFSGGCKRT